MAGGCDVFISYARGSSAASATALRERLDRSGASVFLDTREEVVGDGIVDQVFDGLAAARVVVVFAAARYFTSRYCAEELAIALAALRAVRRLGVAPEELDGAIAPVVVALPATGGLEDLGLLPPELQRQNWPREDETDRLAELVRTRLARVRETVGERLERLGQRGGLRERLQETIAIPVPKQLGGVPLYHDEGLPPSIGEGFVGRSRELWELHSELAVKHGGAAARTVSLEGGGGFGKTRLALEYLHRYGPPEYPGGLFWVNADVPDDRLDAQQHAILRLLRPDVPELAAFRESRRDIRRELGDALRDVARTRRVLFVVDNVPEPDGEQPPPRIGWWCPAAGQVSLLLTSRAQHALVRGVRRLEIAELSRSAATMILLHGYEDRSAISDVSWRQVVAWVGEWPLALELLNASLHAGAVGPRQLLATAKADSPAVALERQMAALRGVVPEGTLRGVAEALMMSYRRLPAEMRRAARQLAWLAPSPIPMALMSHVDPSTRAQLRTRSFVTEVRPGAVDMYGRMHRVLADFLRGEAEDVQAEAAATCSALLQVVTFDACVDPAQWSLMNLCQPHAAALLAWGAAHATSSALVEDVVTIGRRLNRLLLGQGQPEAAAETARTGLAVARQVLGPDHLSTVASELNLAWTLWKLGDLDEARRLQEHGLDVRRRVLGEEHPETLTALVNVADTLRDLGEVERSHQMQVVVLETRRRVLGENHRHTIWAASDVAETLRLLGRLGEAEALQQGVLAAFSQHDRGDLDTLLAMSQMAGILRAQGELGRALELQEHVVDGRRRRLELEHPDTLSAIADLAVTLRRLGQLARAAELAEQVLDVRRRLLGDGHPNTVSAMEGLAAVLRAQGQDQRAVDLERQALAARRRLRPHTRPEGHDG